MPKEQGIAEFLLQHAEETPVSFHMPGHKGQKIYRRFGYDKFLNRFFDCDITEIIGADNLFQSEGIIAETMSKYRRLYDSKASYLLINGTSGGIIASILALVPQGKKLVVARNCHKSVFNALTLGNIQAVYAYPSVVEEYGIAGPVSPEEIEALLVTEPDVEAVILPSPNYYGICSDITAIADVVHSHGKKFIVDQAHGAHLKFFYELISGHNLPLAAEDCGADIVINSVHKTLASLTQSAVLNVCGEIDLYTLEDKLQSIESTSPSYILMASLDINADIIAAHGLELLTEWYENLEFFYSRASQIKGLEIMNVRDGERQAMDITKINLDMSNSGFDGNTLEQELLREGIFAELVTGNILMCMTGIGNTRRDYDRLLKVLENLASKSTFENETNPQMKTNDNAASLWTKHRPLHEIHGEKQLVNIDKCEGKICASSIIPYPPGIPLICPGEQLNSEDIEYIKLLRKQGEKVIGIDSKNRIAVCK